MSVVVMVPTWNERENIAPLLDALLALPVAGLTVLIVDDASPDGTADVVRERATAEPRVRLLYRPAQRGRGFAGAEGFRAAVAAGAEAVVEMDADFSHDPADIPRLLAALGTADVVLGSRAAAGGGESGRGLGRRILTRVAAGLVRLVLGVRVGDPTSGFRAFRRDALVAIRPETLASPGPGIVQEVLYRAQRAGLRIVEVPITFNQRTRGKSKLGPSALLRVLWGLLALRWRGVG